MITGPMRGWIITSNVQFDSHSIVDRGAAGLLDITALNDTASTCFLPHDGSENEVDTLPNQVIALDGCVK